jgi:hypothetical protein
VREAYRKTERDGGAGERRRDTELEKYGESEATTESISYALGGTLGVQTSERERERNTTQRNIYIYTIFI